MCLIWKGGEKDEHEEDEEDEDEDGEDEDEEEEELQQQLITHIILNLRNKYQNTKAARSLRNKKPQSTSSKYYAGKLTHPPYIHTHRNVSSQPSPWPPDPLQAYNKMVLSAYPN